MLPCHFFHHFFPFNFLFSDKFNVLVFSQPCWEQKDRVDKGSPSAIVSVVTTMSSQWEWNKSASKRVGWDHHSVVCKCSKDTVCLKMRHGKLRGSAVASNLQIVDTIDETVHPRKWKDEPKISTWNIQQGHKTSCAVRAFEVKAPTKACG